MNWLIDWLIRRAQPYRKGHLYNSDGSLYMMRYALFETRWISARLHHIATEDMDRAMHDHPWSFCTIVLHGGYLEARPITPFNPSFDAPDGGERVYLVARRADTCALRRATDRHRILDVLDNTWTLFIYGPMRQWWGFFTPAGKIFWRDYENHKGGAQQT